MGKYDDEMGRSEALRTAFEAGERWRRHMGMYQDGRRFDDPPAETIDNAFIRWLTRTDATEPRTCRWKGGDGYWSTGCGRAVGLQSSPVGAEFRHCPYCGGRLVTEVDPTGAEVDDG